MIRSILIIALSFCLSAALVSSCKKAEDSGQVILSSKDPQALSAASKVWHGERVQGIAPVQNGGSLQLNTTTSPFIYAFAGRYAVIQPQIARGNIKGYYLQFNGAKEYFKIDYSRPREGRSRSGGKSVSPFLRSNRMDSTGGNADSAIVIALPSNLQLPDTFCVKYCAYDLQGNISNVVTTCIVVSTLATDQANSWITGEWRTTSVWAALDSVTRAVDTIIYNRWMSRDHYYCVNGQLTYVADTSMSVAADSIFYNKYHLALASNGAMKMEAQALNKNINLSTSNCIQINYSPVKLESELFNGAWNYNPTTKKITLVWEENLNGTPILNASQYGVVKINDRQFLSHDLNGIYYFRYEK